MMRLQIFCCHNYLFVTDAIGLGYNSGVFALYVQREKFYKFRAGFCLFFKGYLLRDERLSFSA